MAPVLQPFEDPVEADRVAAATRRWLERAVIGLNLCPFARAVHVRGQVRQAITAAASPDGLLAELRHELGLLAAADPTEIETTLLVHPRALTDFVEFSRFLPRADAALRKLGLRGRLQLASFHPNYEFADAAPDDVSHCTNRSPYPTLHLLREDSIDRAVAAFPDPAAIYERNIDTLRALGRAGWERLLGPDPAD